MTNILGSILTTINMTNFLKRSLSIILGRIITLTLISTTIREAINNMPTIRTTFSHTTRKLLSLRRNIAMRLILMHTKLLRKRPC